MNRIDSLPTLLCALLGIQIFMQSDTATAAPVVKSMSPGEVRSGDVLEVQGAGFKGTREVLFVSGIAVKQAKFKIIADDHLEVVFPEFYLGTGSASIIVVGMDSVTVAMSNKMKTVDVNSGSRVSAPFLNVLKDGIVHHDCAAIAVIQDGGLVAKSHGSAVCFVKTNGTLAEFGGAIIFHEPGAIYGPKLQAMKTPPKLVAVHEITISPDVDPVLIKKPEVTRPVTRQPPFLASIAPAMAMPGDIVVLSGRHLGHVTKVLFVDMARGPVEAGFKAIHDDVLRVEVPQGVTRRQLVVVMNPTGAAVNITENPPPPFQTFDRQAAHQEMFNSASFLLEYVRMGQIESSGGGSRIYVIPKGGTVAHAGGGCCFFVRNGGRLSADVGGGCTIFHEPGAIVPTAAVKNLPAGLTNLEVGRIIFSEQPLHLDVGHRF